MSRWLLGSLVVFVGDVEVVGGDGDDFVSFGVVELRCWQSRAFVYVDACFYFVGEDSFFSWFKCS